MVWYYRDNDQEVGPVSKAELQGLVKSKRVSAQTLVRSVEMTEWVPLIDVVRGKAGQPQSPPPPPLNAASDEPQTSQAESDDIIEEMTMASESGSSSEVRVCPGKGLPKTKGISAAWKAPPPAKMGLS